MPVIVPRASTPARMYVLPFVQGLNRFYPKSLPYLSTTLLASRTLPSALNIPNRGPNSLSSCLGIIRESLPSGLSNFDLQRRTSPRKSDLFSPSL